MSSWYSNASIALLIAMMLSQTGAGGALGITGAFEKLRERIGFLASYVVS